MNLPISVTQSELTDVLLNVATIRPVFIWGAPGIGKSALVEKFAEDVGLPCVSLLGSQLAPEDIIGIPQIKGETSEFLPPKMIARKEPYVLFPDELNACSQEYALEFAHALTHAVSWTIDRAANHESSPSSRAKKASQWFLNRYPLLGGVASAFRIVEDYKICQKNDIQIAAVDVTLGEIYINPSVWLSEDELKFILAHEYLHAGLLHYERCQGRNAYLWNVACDYVINGWLVELEIGEMPRQGLLYDES